MTVLADVLSLLVGSVLLLAGVLKLRHRTDLNQVLEAVAGWVPPPLREAVARILPLVEVGAGGGLLLWPRQYELVVGVCFLFGIFSLLTLWIAASKQDVSCRCFGRYFAAGPWTAFLRSALLFAASLGAVLLQPPIERQGLVLIERVLPYLLSAAVFVYGWILAEARDVRDARLANQRGDV